MASRKGLPTRARGPFAGIQAVFQFNYPFYIGAALVTVVCVAFAQILAGAVVILLWAAALGAVYMSVASAGASHWIYDRSDLYRFSWLAAILDGSPQRVAVLHAGYDEVTALLSGKFPNAIFSSYDFLRPSERTEPSIVRARALYGDPDAVQLEPGSPLSQSYSAILLLLSAHELRTADERVRLLTGIRESTVPSGTIVLVEHVRNWANFLAFGPGAFHFWSRSSWEADFAHAGLEIKKQFAITPFLRGYFLK